MPPDSEPTLDQLLPFSREVLVVVDDKYCITFVSPSVERMLGYSSDHLLQSQLCDLIPPGPDQERWKAAVDQAAQTIGEPQNPIEIKVLHVDETVRNLEIVHTHINDGALHGTLLTILDITDRTTVDAAFQATDRRYTAVYRDSTDAVAVVEATGTVSFVASSYHQLTGRELGDAGFSPGDLMDHVHEEDRESLEALFFSAVKAGEQVGVAGQFRLNHMDGSTRWIKVRFRACFDDPEIAGVIVNFTDISSQYQLEAERSSTEERLRNIFNFLPFAITVFENDGRASFYNHQAEKLNDRVRVNRKNVAVSFQAGTDMKYPWVEKWTALGTDTAYFDDIEMELRNGGRAPFESWIAPLRFDDDGTMLQMIMVSNDITERRRMESMEQELRVSDEKRRVIVENANEGITVIQNGMLKFSNPNLEEITGYSNELLTSRPFVSFIHPDDQSIFIDHHRNLPSDGKPSFSYSFRVLDQLNKIKWIVVNAVGIDWDGEQATLEFLTDVTDRKRAEEELQKIEKLGSVGILAGGIAHDLNNFLTGALGSISLARMEADPVSKDRILSDAERACLQIRNLTQQLLTFSTGGAPILSVTDVSTLLHEAVDLALSGSNVESTVAIAADLWRAELDEGQMNQVINNLIVNARQAMPNGGKLRITATNLHVNADSGLPLSPGAHLKITVADDGMGIPENLLQQVFDPFFTTREEGNGLGLATSFSIIEKHLGHITVESIPGTGTSFHIYVPATPDAPRVEEKVKTLPVSGSGRILVMDDDEPIRKLVCLMLERLGYEVFATKNGEAAVEQYGLALSAGTPFDAVILDLTIRGGMGGEETISKLVELDPEVSAIVSSGYSTDPIMANFEDYGFKGVVAKPYKIRELSGTLADVISIKSQTDRTTTETSSLAGAL